MSRQRKLSPDVEAALIAWYREYQAMLTKLRRMGSVKSKAREHGLSTRTLFYICNRSHDDLRRAKRMSTKSAA